MDVGVTLGHNCGLVQSSDSLWSIHPDSSLMSLQELSCGWLAVSPMSTHGPAFGPKSPGRCLHGIEGDWWPFSDLSLLGSEVALPAPRTHSSLNKHI